jgi:glycosyltransferase involved in cell wall biosynthesis
LGVLERISQFSVDDDALAALYRQAVAFVFPSLYEGFGIPILEAFSADCPVLLSNRSSLPEVAGGAAIYFEPDDEQSLRSAMLKILEDDSFRHSLSALGRERLNVFSWDRVAQETKIVYERLL